MTTPDQLGELRFWARYRVSERIVWPTMRYEASVAERAAAVVRAAQIVRSAERGVLGLGWRSVSARRRRLTRLVRSLA